MPKIAYIDNNFRAATMAVIQQANQIIDEYLEDGFTLTLRQLYYQFVARGLIANKDKEYDRLGTIINNGRLGGLIDWDAIEDRSRSLKSRPSWEDPGEIIGAAAYSFKLDRWEGQPHRVEVWIEKEALTGVIQKTCSSLDVPYFACKGYNSQSEMWRSAQRFNNYQAGGYRGIQTPVIIHLGDHDPSGVDMTRDILDRQKLFLNHNAPIVNRIALNMDQIEKYNPPPNPAKLSDSRCENYITEYGYESWELDALEPKVMTGLVERTILSYRDEDIYQETMDQEMEYKQILKNIEENWETL